MSKWLTFLAVLVASSVLSQEIAVTPPNELRAAGWQMAPAVASDGAGYFAVWQDYRSGDPAIYGSLIDASGSIRAQDRLRISFGPGASTPTVAWDGRYYLVVWSEYEGCFFRRIDARGSFVDAWPKQVLGRYTAYPQIAISPRGAVVAAAVLGFGSYAGIELSLITQDDRVLPRGKISGSRSFTIGCAGHDCLVAWVKATPGWGDVAPFPLTQHYSVIGRSLTPDGQLMGDERELVDNAYDPRIVTSGDRTLLVWKTDELNNAIRGSLDQGEPFTIASSSEGKLGEFAVAADGDQFMACWVVEKEMDLGRRARRIFRSIEAQRVGPDGTVGPRFTLTSQGVANGWRQALALAGNGTTFVAAWPEEESSGQTKIAVSMVYGHGRAERLPVAMSASHQERPRIVRAEDHYLAVWAEDRRSDGRLAILARRFRLDTSPMDREPLVVAESMISLQGPSVSSDGRSFLIAWSRNGWIQARRLTGEGTMGPLVSIGRSSQPPSIAASGGSFGLLYREQTPDDQSDTLTFARVEGDQVVVRRSISTTSKGEYSIAWNGSAFVAAWTDFEPPNGWWRLDRLLMQYLTRDGVPVSPEPAVVRRGRQGHSPSIYSPSIACDVEQCALAWYVFLEGVGAARARDGAVIPVGEPFNDVGEYRPPSSQRFEPSVVQTNESFLVTAFSEGRVYARSIVSGTFAEESVLWLANEKVLDRSIARGVGNTVAVAYQRSDAAAGGAQRVFLRLVPVE